MSKPDATPRLAVLPGRIIAAAAVLALVLTLLPARAPALKAAGPQASLTVINKSDVDICYVYLVPAGNDNWGDDWLGAKNTIAPGDTLTLELDAGKYDARAESCDGEALSEVRGAEISGTVNWTVRGDDKKPDEETEEAEETIPPDDEQPFDEEQPEDDDISRRREEPAVQAVTLDQFLCCGQSVGGTNIWSIRYPRGWQVDYFGTKKDFFGAAFYDPEGSIRVTYLPSAMPEAGGPLDTGEVDSFLDALGQQRRHEDPGFEEFLREEVPGVADVRIWGGTWPGDDERMWETYVVFAASLGYVIPEMSQTYFSLMGVRAASPDWAAGVKIYEDMLATVQVKWLEEGHPEVNAVDAGKPAVEPGMVRFCPRQCEWEWISASQPGWPCPVYGEESSPYEVPCESPGADGD